MSFGRLSHSLECQQEYEVASVELIRVDVLHVGGDTLLLQLAIGSQKPVETLHTLRPSIDSC